MEDWDRQAPPERLTLLAFLDDRQVDMGFHLLFHGVGKPRRELEPGEADLWISPSQLHETLDLIANTDVRVSVDDGNVSDLEVILPALKCRSLMATFFPIAGRIGEPGSLSASAIRELRDEGMPIGSHGMRHRPWRRLTADEEYEEFVVARERLMDVLQRPVNAAACPRGAYDRRSLRVLRRLGYSHVFTSDRGPSDPEAWIQARDSIRRWDDRDSVAAAVIRGPSAPTRLVMYGKRLIKRLR